MGIRAAIWLLVVIALNNRGYLVSAGRIREKFMQDLLADAAAYLDEADLMNEELAWPSAGEKYLLDCSYCPMTIHCSVYKVPNIIKNCAKCQGICFGGYGKYDEDS